VAAKIAAMLDPHTGAKLPLDEIEELVDELLWAHGDLVPPLVLWSRRTVAGFGAMVALFQQGLEEAGAGAQLSAGRRPR
jgi:hypothetical protein